MQYTTTLFFSWLGICLQLCKSQSNQPHRSTALLETVFRERAIMSPAGCQEDRIQEILNSHAILVEKWLDCVCEAAADDDTVRMRGLLRGHSAAGLGACSEKYGGPPLASAVLHGNLAAGNPHSIILRNYRGLLRLCMPCMRATVQSCTDRRAMKHPTPPRQVGGLLSKAAGKASCASPAQNCRRVLALRQQPAARANAAQVSALRTHSVIPGVRLSSGLLLLATPAKTDAAGLTRTCAVQRSCWLPAALIRNSAGSKRLSAWPLRRSFGPSPVLAGGIPGSGSRWSSSHACTWQC